jgi:hypothetical protein
MDKIPAALMLAAVTTLSACAGTAGASIDSTGAAAGAAPSASPAAVEAEAAIPSPEGAITAEEAEGLLFMREEEKLARDVYLAMFDLWDLRVFDNIAASEQRHTDAVLDLIEAYGLTDPVADDTPGEFTDPELATLYADLIEAGSGSPEEALAVGALIEDLDISDLRSWLEATDDPAIQRVYSNLLAGSENHLRAFAGLLEGRGVDYEPTYLSEDDVADILGAPSSGGGRGGVRHSGRRSR